MVLLGLGAWAVTALSGEDDPVEVVTPRHLTDGGIAHPGSPAQDAPVVEVYEDFLCSHCAEFEAEHGAFLTDLADRGEISLRFVPMTILDGRDDTGPAHDAMNAAMCVADEQGAEAFWAMKPLLFDARYHTGDEQPTTEALAEIARDAGATDPEPCLESSRFVPWLNEAGETARERGVTGTPSVFIDGEKLEDTTKIRSALADATS